MRAIMITSACLIAFCGTANAGSVETVRGKAGDRGSVVSLGCKDCPPIVRKTPTYIVPEVAPGRETVELKEIGGRMKILRTEAWSGGSPVVFVTTASEDVIKAAQAKAPTETVAQASASALPAVAAAQSVAAIASPVIDATMTTGALEKAAMATVPPASPDINLNTFELRLN